MRGGGGYEAEKIAVIINRGQPYDACRDASRRLTFSCKGWKIEGAIAPSPSRQPAKVAD
jgi:hypothetical protein